MAFSYNLLRDVFQNDLVETGCEVVPLLVSVEAMRVSVEVLPKFDYLPPNHFFVCLSILEHFACFELRAFRLDVYLGCDGMVVAYTCYNHHIVNLVR